MTAVQTLFGTASCAPLIKYAGCKSWLAKILAPRLRAHLESVQGTYVETFAGSLAMGLAIDWPNSVYSDTNADLVNLYRAVARSAGEVADEIDLLRSVSGEASYYATRESVWPVNRGALSSAAWAARTIWLNKNCFNGLMRYHEKNATFNVPWGKREGVVLPSRERVARVATVLARAKIAQADFASVLDLILADAVFHSGDARRLVVYLDSPYWGRLKNASACGVVACPGKDSGVFTGYTGRFTWEDQVRLADWANALAARGALVIASNAWSDEIRDLYRGRFALFQVGVRHSVGATGERRGKRAEMVAVSEAHAGALELVLPVKIV